MTNERYPRPLKDEKPKANIRFAWKVNPNTPKSEHTTQSKLGAGSSKAASAKRAKVTLPTLAKLDGDE